VAAVEFVPRSGRLGLGAAGAPKVGWCKLKPGEIRVDRALVPEVGEVPCGPVVPHSDKWGSPPVHHSALESKM